MNDQLNEWCTGADEITYGSRIRKAGEQRHAASVDLYINTHDSDFRQRRAETDRSEVMPTLHKSCFRTNEGSDSNIQEQRGHLDIKISNFKKNFSYFTITMAQNPDSKDCKQTLDFKATVASPYSAKEMDNEVLILNALF